MKWTVIRPLFKRGKGCLYYLCKGECGHYVKVRKDTFNTAMCYLCKIEKRQASALEKGLRLVSHGHSKDHGVYELPCGCQKEISYQCINLNTGLKCSKHDSPRMTFLYAILMEVDNTSWVKIGITSNTLGSRFLRYHAMSGTKIYCVGFNIFETRDEAKSEEKRLKLLYKPWQVSPRDMREYIQNGYTECFDVSIVTSLQQEMNLRNSLTTKI